jgi:molybdate transport system substrate-binding protein
MLLLAALASFPRPARSEITIFAAASLKNALEEFTNTRKTSKASVVLHFAASSQLALQLRQGARADIFLSADSARMDDLERRNLIDKSSRVDLLSNRLVIVSGMPKELRDPASMASDPKARIALANPRIVPAGVYARQFLESLQLWDRLSPQVLPCENVRAALAAVEAGNAAYAIVYSTDARISNKVHVVHEVDPRDTPKITYTAALLRDASPEAADILRELHSPEAMRCFEKFGFIPLFPHDPPANE